jgi:hypothetical protein
MEKFDWSSDRAMWMWLQDMERAIADPSLAVIGSSVDNSYNVLCDWLNKYTPDAENKQFYKSVQGLVVAYQKIRHST